MPSVSPTLLADAEIRLKTIGQQLRDHRKRLRLSATSVAEAAGMSRVTLHRIERGEPSVTMGAYLNAMQALQLDFGLLLPPTAAAPAVPERIALADYPQLRQLAWHIGGDQTLTPQEAADLYERNARHLDEPRLQPQERALIDALRAMTKQRVADV
jgi:transcriptional regulator with XRE-family HTH domain